MSETKSGGIAIVSNEEAAEVLTLFCGLPSDKRAAVIAFMNGMETQRTIDEIAKQEGGA